MQQRIWGTTNAATNADDWWKLLLLLSVDVTPHHHRRRTGAYVCGTVLVALVLIQVVRVLERLATTEVLAREPSGATSTTTSSSSSLKPQCTVLTSR